MPQLKGTRLYFVIVGVIEVVLSVTFVICTKFVLEKYSDVNGVEAYSLFYLYYAIPGVLCILSGVTASPKTYVKASIGFHIISVVVSTIGAAVSSVFWQMYKESDACEDTEKGECICFKKSYAITCEDGELSRILLAVLTAASIFMIMTSFIGSILGCTNVCCDPLSRDRASRNETSHSDQTVLSTTHPHHVHDTAAVDLNSGHINIDLKTMKETGAPPNTPSKQITHSGTIYMENSV